MKLWIALLAILIASMWSGTAFNAEKTTYPPPRFPSYVKPPKSIDDVLPYARAAVRQTGGRTPLGLVEKGTVLIVTEATAEEMVLQAIRRAYEERGVKVQIVPDYELVGISKEEARRAREATRGFASEQGYMEAERWISRQFSDPEVPKKWLKERRPDLYKALFEKEAHITPQLKATVDKLTRKGLSEGLIKYLDKHPEMNAVFFQRGGRTAASRTMGEHSKKFFGNFIFDNRWELMNKAATFPGDVWRLAEERIIEPLAWVDRVHVTDPEGPTSLLMSMKSRHRRGLREDTNRDISICFPTRPRAGFPTQRWTTLPSRKNIIRAFCSRLTAFLLARPITPDLIRESRSV